MIRQYCPNPKLQHYYSMYHVPLITCRWLLNNSSNYQWAKTKVSSCSLARPFISSLWLSPNQISQVWVGVVAVQTALELTLSTRAHIKRRTIDGVSSLLYHASLWILLLKWVCEFICSPVFEAMSQTLQRAHMISSLGKMEGVESKEGSY